MNNFFKQIYNKILKFDEYTNQYLKVTNNIEIPSLAYTNWGNYFANLKDFNSAIEKLETAMLMSNQNPKPCIYLGTIYAKLKEYNKAEEVLKEAIRRDTQNSYAYSVLSSIYVVQDRFEEAEDFLKKALKLSSSNSEIYLNYGILYAKMQKKTKAIEMLKKAKFYNPANIHTYFILGVLLFETEKIPEAFIEFKEIEKINPRYRNLNYYMALCYKKESNHMAVLEYAQRALEDDPNNPSIYVLLAQTYITLKQFDKVQQIYLQGEKQGINDFDFFLSWGISLLRINKISEAKDKIEKALQKNPQNSIALYRLGSCFHKENNIEKAEEYFNKAIELDAYNTSAIADLGMIYYEKKDYNSAIQTFFKAINISSEKAFLYFYIANCYYKLGRYKKSIEYYEKTIEYYPNHIEAYINYTLCLLSINNIKEALRKIRSAYQINRNSEKVILIYAYTDLKSGIYTDAIEKSDILLNKNPENREAKFIKIQTLINLRKPQEALNILDSLSENEKQSEIFTFLSYIAYKILVEDNPSNYNENMLNEYLNKINNMNIETVNEYLLNAINKH
ncbi:tetratricopeptide repeat protein [bacterium]|nr:tetratricopeptide repeat protein [bacterium]